MIHAELDDLRACQLQQRLHDGLGQCLSLAAMQIDRAAVSDEAGEADALRRARVLVGEALRELRSLIHCIEHPEAEAPGADLPGRLESCVRRLNAMQPVPVCCTIEGAPIRMPAPACEVLLSATRELLINACKHGRAQGIEARLTFVSQRVSITVSEHGTMSASAVDEPVAAPGHGMGLPATRRNLAAIGARLRWRHGGADGVQARISWVAP
ncbi:histidine kinase [Ideonella sp. DXS29W]|uniref:histidine kinase n=1 Tax=Ideonella lacteola TaxID=2984193 RepID=A0ABU9BWW2_9BURK